MKRVLTDKVVEDFADITTPLKAFVEAVYAPYEFFYLKNLFKK